MLISLKMTEAKTIVLENVSIPLFFNLLSLPVRELLDTSPHRQRLCSGCQRDGSIHPNHISTAVLTGLFLE